jgi:hypothetical protein
MKSNMQNLHIPTIITLFTVGKNFLHTDNLATCKESLQVSVVANFETTARKLYTILNMKDEHISFNWSEFPTSSEEFG